MSGFSIVKLTDPIQFTTVSGGLVPRGAYNGATTYSVGDSVDYNGSSYVLFSAAVSGTLPTDTTKWQVLANKGSAGATGATGSTGATGAAGADGRVQTVVAGTNVTVDATDPANPIVSSTGGGGSGAWGGITGTLSDQTDLQTALNAKVPTTRTVAGHALSGDVTVSKSDVGLGSVTDNAQLTVVNNLSDVASASSARANLKVPVWLVPTTVVSGATYTTLASEYVPVDTTSNNVTVTLPTAPADKTRIGIKHVIRGGTNTVTISTGGTDVFNKASGATSETLTLVNQGIMLQYESSSHIWYIQSTDFALSQLDSRFVAAATTVNGHALSSNVTVTAADVGLGNVNNTSNATERAATAALTNKDLTSGTNTFPTLNQNTSGTAANLSGTPALPNGTTATTQAAADNSTKLASTAYTDSAVAAGQSAVRTLTNARITKRVLALSAGSATPAINTDSYDVVHITGQSAAITSFTTNLTGSPVDGDMLRISITDNGTSRALTWGTSFEASTIALPTATTISTRLECGFVWNSETNHWRIVATG